MYELCQWGLARGGIPVRPDACNMVEVARPQPHGAFTLHGIKSKSAVMGLWGTRGDTGCNACVTVSREGIAAVWALRPLRKFEPVVTDFRPSALDPCIREAARRFYTAVLYVINFLSVQLGCSFRHMFIEENKAPASPPPTGDLDVLAVHTFKPPGLVLLAGSSVEFRRRVGKIEVVFGHHEMLSHAGQRPPRT